MNSALDYLADVVRMHSCAAHTNKKPVIAEVCRHIIHDAAGPKCGGSLECKLAMILLANGWAEKTIGLVVRDEDAPINRSTTRVFLFFLPNIKGQSITAIWIDDIIDEPGQ